MRKKIFLILVLGFSLSVFSQDVLNTKRKKIEQLLEISGSAKNGIFVMNSLMNIYKKQYPNVKQSIWDDFSKEVNEKDLANLIIPIYDKYFTESDIDNYIAFYKTEAGQKMIENLPKITQDSMTAGQEWGKEISNKILQKLKEEGY